MLLVHVVRVLQHADQSTSSEDVYFRVPNPFRHTQHSRGIRGAGGVRLSRVNSIDILRMYARAFINSSLLTNWPPPSVVWPNSPRDLFFVFLARSRGHLKLLPYYFYDIVLGGSLISG